jgi:rare lipoprotein A
MRRGRAVIATSIATMLATAPLRLDAVDRSHRTQRGVASFYGHREAGRKTASGVRLAPGRMTAASPTLPLGTRAKVTNTKSGKSAQVTIIDRGPYAKGRILDVTPKAAQQLGITKTDGVAPVEVKPIAEPVTPPQ